MSHPNIRFLDRAKETTTTTGFGTISLAGAVAGFVGISGIGNGNSTYYTLQEGNNFEVGIGTYTTAGNTLSRDEVFSSSNSDDSKIDLAGSTTVFITYPADKAVVKTSGNYVGIGIDPEYQLQVSGTGSFNTVRWADGTTQTTADTDTTYTAGTGLTLVGTRFDTSGTGYFDSLGIGTGAIPPTYTLHVAGDAGFDEYIYHNGDGNTFIRFAPDLINLVAGSWSAIKLEKSTGKVQLNNGNHDLDVEIMADDGEVILHTDAGTNNVGIGTVEPSYNLEVSGTGSFNMVRWADGTNQITSATGDISTVSGLTVTNATNIASTGASNLSLIRSYIDTSDNATFNNLIAQGNLTVSGTLTYLDSTTVTIADKQLELASNSGTPIGNDSAVNDGGIVVKSTDSDKKWTWLDATDAWTSTENISLDSSKKIIFGDSTEQTTSPTGDIATVSGLTVTNATNIASTGATNAAAIAAKDNYQYWTATDGDATSNISTTEDVKITGAGQVTVSLVGGSPNVFTVSGAAAAAGAPTDAQYVTLALDGDLSAERVLAASTGVHIVDGGANGNVTVSVSGSTTSQLGIVQLQDSATDGTVDKAITPNAVYDIQTTLQTNINTNTTNIASTGATNAAAAATNATNISTNTTNISTNATNIASTGATNAAAAATNATNISTNATNIASTGATNAAAAATNATNISTNATNISTNATNISTNTTNIASTGATNSAAAATNATNISTNATNISTNTTNIASTGATNAAHIATVSGLLSSPGGSDTQIQFNDGGSFGGDSDLIWHKTHNLLTVNGTGVVDRIGVNDSTPDAMVGVVCANATDIGLKIEMMETQSVNPLEIVHSDGTPRFSTDMAGDISCGAISGSGANFILGRTDISPTIRVAAGGNNLNLRNPNSDKDIDLDVHHSGGAINFRDYDNYTDYFHFKMRVASNPNGTGMFIRSRDNTSILTQWQSSGGTPVAMVNPTGAISGQHFIFGDGTTQSTASAGGGEGAPTDAQYVTLALDGDLSAERVLTSSTGIHIVDGGANGNVTVSVSGSTTSQLGIVQLQDSATDGTIDKAITPNAVYDIQTTLQTNINTNTTNISTNATNISTNTTNIASTGATNAAHIATVSGLLSSPGGSDTQIQFNDGGSFAGDSDLIWNKTHNLLTVNGTGVVDKLGVNDATPGAMLDIVSDDANTIGLIVEGHASQASDLLNLNSSSANLLAVDKDGFLGIGVDPSYVLHIDKNPDASASNHTLIYARGGDSTKNSSFEFAAGIGDSNNSAIFKLIAGTAGSSYMYFGDTDSASVGQFRYQHSSNTLFVKTSASNAVAWDSNQKRHDYAGSYMDIESNTDASTVTFDLDESNIHTVTVTADRTFAVSNADIGQRFMIRVLQDGTGGHSGTWWSTIKWAGGTPPVQPIAGNAEANKAQLYGFLCTSAANYDGFVIGTGIA